MMYDFIKLMLYSGIYNVILMSLYYFEGSVPTIDALFFGGVANILVALILFMVITFTKGETK